MACRISRQPIKFDHLTELAILPRKGSMIMHVYKNGGTVANSITHTEGGSTYQHGSLQYPQDFLRELIRNEDWFRTALVRDPIDRVLSAFHEVEKRKCEHWAARCEKESAKSVSEHVADLVSMLLSIDKHPEKKPDWYVVGGYHFLPQIHFMIDKDKTKFPLDYVGNASNMAKELAFILDDPQLLKPGAIPELHGPIHDDSSNNKFRLRRKSLTPKVLEIICRMYHDDYCCFGFEFPEECKTHVCDHA